MLHALKPVHARNICVKQTGRKTNKERKIEK
jgi:hypothetical protein